MLPLREVRELAAFWQSLSLTCSHLGAAAQLTVMQASGICLSGCIQHLCFVTSCAVVQCLPFHLINWLLGGVLLLGRIFQLSS